MVMNVLIQGVMPIGTLICLKCW